jgi:hypothetical protein
MTGKKANCHLRFIAEAKAVRQAARIFRDSRRDRKPIAQILPVSPRQPCQNRNAQVEGCDLTPGPARCRFAIL